jgi:CheY-like chemotaxis protein
MTALVMILMLIAFVMIDLAVRAVGRRVVQERERREREAALGVAVRMEFADDVRSLVRAVAPHAKARILAVDDEAIVLDSFRKILVLDGFSVDTVESGPEALSMVRGTDYDFVFTDLKMPGMNGVEVVKAVHHLRPDVDIAVITGYGTIDSAVETMQHGAVEYVQKPFTEDELVSFARHLLIKRRARLEAARRPLVLVTTPDDADTARECGYAIPGGAFVSPGHVWARIDPGGRIKVGVDDFTRKALGGIECVSLPDAGASVTAGGTLFTLHRGQAAVRCGAPVSGTVAVVNDAAGADALHVRDSPYVRGWICVIAPRELARELERLRIGLPLVAWYQDEAERLRDGSWIDGSAVPPEKWGDFERAFLTGGT